MIECSNCGHPIEEPETSCGINCPGCATLLLVPSRKDWEAMKFGKDFNTPPPEYMKPSGWKASEPIICTVCALESEHYPGTLPLNFSPCRRCGTYSWKRQ